MLARPALSMVLRDSVWAVWAAAGGIGLAGCMAMLEAGRTNRAAHDRGRMTHARAVLLIVLWLVMGLFVAAIRVYGISELSAGIGPGSDGLSGAAITQAAAFLAVFAVVGVLAYGDGHSRAAH